MKHLIDIYEAKDVPLWNELKDLNNPAKFPTLEEFTRKWVSNNNEINLPPSAVTKRRLKEKIWLQQLKESFLNWLKSGWFGRISN